VSARVHHRRRLAAGVLGHDGAGKREPGFFSHRQRVELGAQHHRRPRAVLHDGDDTRAADAGGDVESESLHPRGQLGGRQIAFGNRRDLQLLTFRPGHRHLFVPIGGDDGDLLVAVGIHHLYIAVDFGLLPRLLDLKAGDPVIVLRRVLEFGGTPTVLDEITLPAALFRGLTKARYDAHHGSMYGFFETQFGVRMLKAQERLRAIAADPASAALLYVEPGHPLLAVDRVALTYGDRPVEWRRGLCVTRAHCYVNELG